MASSSLGFDVSSISTLSRRPSNWSRISRARFMLLTWKIEVEWMLWDIHCRLNSWPEVKQWYIIQRELITQEKKLKHSPISVFKKLRQSVLALNKLTIYFQNLELWLHAICIHQITPSIHRVKLVANSSKKNRGIPECSSHSTTVLNSWFPSRNCRPIHESSQHQ